MRPARRVIKAKRTRIRLEPKRPSLTQNMDALRRGREALSSIEGQLGALLDAFRLGKVDAGAADRLARARSEACEAMAGLQSFAQI